MKEKRTRPVDVRGRRLDLTKGGCDIELPSDPHERVSLFHQEAVAEVGRGSWILTSVRAAIEAPEESLAPPIGDLEQQRAVAFLRVNRAQDIEIGGEVHAAICAACRVLEIDDARVVLVGGIERELDRAGELLVRPDLIRTPGLRRRRLRLAIVTFVTSARIVRWPYERAGDECEEPTYSSIASMPPGPASAGRDDYLSPASSNTVFAMTELSSSPRPAAIVAWSSCWTTAVTGAALSCSASVATTFRMSFANRCVLNPGLYVPLSARSPCTSSTRLCREPAEQRLAHFAGVDAGLARQRERFGDDGERAADHHLVADLAQLTGARLADVDDLLGIAHRRRGSASRRRTPAASPPTMIDSVPLMAPMSPPLTGASSIVAPQ